MIAFAIGMLIGPSMALLGMWLGFKYMDWLAYRKPDWYDRPFLISWWPW